MKFDVCSPILGFEGIKQVELEKIDDTFMTMKSVDGEDDISFTLVDPYALTEYEFVVPEHIKEMLNITDDSNVLVQNIVIIQKPIEDSLVNFAAPLLFNTDTKQVAQGILDHYDVVEKISKFMDK